MAIHPISNERALEALSNACRDSGLWLMNSAIPLARTVVGIPLAASAFATGFALQMGAHALQPVTHPEWDLSDAFADMDEDSASILR